MTAVFTDNDVQLGLAVLAFLTLLVKQVFDGRSTKAGTAAATAAASSAQEAAGAAQEAAGQLRNNGGSTALDKLQLGQLSLDKSMTALHERLDGHDQRFSAIETRLSLPVPAPDAAGDQAASPP